MFNGEIYVIFVKSCLSIEFHVFLKVNYAVPKINRIVTPIYLNIYISRKHEVLILLESIWLLIIGIEKSYCDYYCHYLILLLLKCIII